MPRPEATPNKQALEHLESAIVEGKFPLGAQLPPERELAVQLGVSRGAVREAIRELRAQGIVESLPGPGRGTRITSGQTAALARMFRLHLAIATTSVKDLYVVRVSLEGATAALAAMHWSASALAQLEALVVEMEETRALDPFNELDTRFHVAIAETAQNVLIGDLTAALREALRVPILEASEQMGDWQELREALAAQHRGIYEAIARRDPTDAVKKMETHIRYAAHRLHLVDEEF